MIGQTISHYRILSKLGEGGMGVVYLAEDTLLRRQVAIKMLTDSELGRQHFRARFLREAIAVSALSHPNIATVYDCGETTKGDPFIVMEFVKGQTLADLINESQLTLERAVEIIIDVGRALGEAHRHGIVHRDIKPSNIAINESGQVKVLDFGLAKQLENVSVGNDNADAPSPVHTQTREGLMIGTPMYVSPEQAIGVPVDARSDLFSLGSVLYECLAGRPPFSGLSPIEICAKVIRDEPAPPSTFNPKVVPDLDRISLKSLAKKPDERYQSAELCIEDLRAAEQSLKSRIPTQKNPLPITAATDTSLHKPQTRRLSSIWTRLTRPHIQIGLVLLSIVMLVALWGLINFWLRKGYQPSPEAKRSYDEGVRALQDGTYYKASNMMDLAIKSDERFALAHARHAEALAELGYFDRASAELSRANLLMNGASLSRRDLLYLQAINASISRDFKGSVESYRQMIQLAEAEDKPYIYVDLGRAYEKNEALTEAMNNYKEAISHNQQYASAYLRLGVLYARRQQSTEAEAAFDRAFTLYRLQANPEGLAEVLYQRGVLFNSQGAIAKAREELESALQVVRTFSNASQHVKTLLQLSSAYLLMGETELAQKNTMEALTMARSNGLNDLTAQSLIGLGNVFFFRNQIAEAEKSYKEALELARSDRARVSETRSLFSLGSLYIQQDNPDEGIPYLTQALPFYQQNGYRKEEMQCQTLLGQAYDLKGNYDEALKAFGGQLQLATDLKNQSQIAFSHKGLGTVLAHQEKYTEALNHFEQSHSIYSAIGNKLYAGYNLLSQAEVSWRLGRYENARAFLSQASSLAEQPDGKFKQLWGRLLVVSAPMALSEQRFAKAIAEGRHAMERDDSITKHPAIESQYTVGLAQALYGLTTKGLKNCERAVEMANRAGDPRLLAGAQLALAEVLLASGDPTRALTMAKQAQQLLERSGQIESEWRASLMIGLAEHRLGDSKSARASLLQADTLLSSLRQRWGDEAVKSYLNRPDIKVYQDKLRRTAALSPATP